MFLESFYYISFKSSHQSVWKWSAKDSSFATTANQLPDAFTSTSKVTKSRISVVNTPTQVIVPTKKSSVKQLMTYLLYARSMTDDWVLKILFPKREKWKNQDSNENNTQAINIFMLFESPYPYEQIVPREIHVPAETHVLKETHVLEET